MNRLLSIVLVSSAFALASSATVRGDGEGQADLNEALRVKVTAEDLHDLNQAIELVEAALDKGLDVETSDFAERLLCESLLERAGQLTAVLRSLPEEGLIDPRLKRVRDQATSDLRRVLTYDEPPLQSLLLLAQLQSMPGGDRREARRLLDKMFKDERIDSIIPPERAEALALRASMQTKPELARKDFDAALELAPKNAAVRLARAEFFREQDLLDEALADVDRLIEQSGGDAAAYLLRAQIERAQQKWDAAETSLAKAAELAPAAVAPLQARGELYRQQDQFDKAIEQFTQILQLQPGNLLALIHRAESYLASGKFAEALVDVDVVLKEQPALVLGHALRAQTLASLERLPEAIEEMEKLVAAVPQQTDYKMQLALYYIVAGEPQKAIGAYTEVLKIEADNFLALRSRGDAYLNMGDHAAAVADFEKAIALEPEDTSLLNNYAWVLATSPDDAVRNGRRAVELATKAGEKTEFKRPHILSTLAAAYAETGDFATARKWSEKAVATPDPDAPEDKAKEMAEELAKELASYEQEKPWRERQTAGKQPTADKKDEGAKEASPAAPPDDKTAASLEQR
jgi:tetratricopeptide (TPR) repeat protein